MGRGLHSIKWPQPHHHRLKAHDPWPPSERKTRVVPHPHPKTPPPKHHLPPAVSRSPHTIPFVWCSQQFLVPPWSDPSLGGLQVVSLLPYLGPHQRGHGPHRHVPEPQSPKTELSCRASRASDSTRGVLFRPRCGLTSSLGWFV